MRKKLLAILLFFVCLTITAQEVMERPYPEEWKRLIQGARFVDRFLPMPDGNLGCGQCALQICRQWYRITRNLILGWKHFEIIRREISSVRVRLGRRFSQRTRDMVGLYCVPRGM